MSASIRPETLRTDDGDRATDPGYDPLGEDVTDVLRRVEEARVAYGDIMQAGFDALEHAAQGVRRSAHAVVRKASNPAMRAVRLPDPK